MSFSTWLKTLPEERTDLIGQDGYDKQLQWWHARPNPFDFEGLPQELQDLVLLHCIGALRPVHISKSMDCSRLRSVPGSSGYWREPLSSAVFEIPKVCHPILALSKRLTPIARDLLHNKTIRQFQSSGGNEEITGKFPATVINARRVQLAFGITQLPEFFRADLPGIHLNSRHMHPDTLLRYPPPAHQLRQWTNLEYLEIYFESTFNQMSTSPWALLLRSKQALWPGMDGSIYPCRRFLVDWIMLFAFEHSKHVPSVNLTR